MNVETKLRMRGVNELETFLQVHGVGENFNPVMESLLPCLKDNNFRVCLGAIGCVQALLRELGEQLRPYLDPLIGACIERMGDNKVIFCLLCDMPNRFDQKISVV